MPTHTFGPVGVTQSVDRVTWQTMPLAQSASARHEPGTQSMTSWTGHGGHASAPGGHAAHGGAIEVVWQVNPWGHPPSAAQAVSAREMRDVARAPTAMKRAIERLSHSRCIRRLLSLAGIGPTLIE